jgi:hypothetical protein
VGQYDIDVEKSRIGGKFFQAKRDPTKDEEDKREALDVNYDATKKVAPSTSIAPEHYVTAT